MNKRQILLCTLVFSGSIAIWAAQVALPGPLANHVKAMSEAPSLIGTLNVQPLPGTPRTVKFQYSKPNFLRIDSEDGFVLCDGKDIYTYTKSTNSYVVEPGTETGILTNSTGDDLWAWASFFNKEPFKGADSAKLGAKRTVKGTKVTEVNVTWLKPTVGQSTIYFEDSGAVKGFSIRNGDKEQLVLVEELVVGKETISASTFAFVAPVDSKKVEAMVSSGSGFAGVQAIMNKNCMPCHNAQNRKSGIDLSSYNGIANNPSSVSPGEPEQSGIYKTTSGPRPSMPKDRPKLKEADLKVMYDWIKAGAKED